MELNGNTLHQWMRDLYPLCRSLTGDGVRETLRYFKAIVPELTFHEIPSGSNCYDWTVPDEWNIEDAYIIDPDGNKIVDFKKHNLHVVGYSTPVNIELTLEELQPHLHSREDIPDAIPYVTSYYQKRWGFCLPHTQREALKPGTYRAVIKSRLEPGSLTYGDIYLPGEQKEEILITSYTCHPSLCNNELSGPIMAIGLAAWLATQKKRRFSYRFYLGPETIGAVCYISKNLELLKERCVGGILLTNCGDEGPFTMIRSRKGDTHMDDLAQHVLRHHTPRHKVRSFLDRASDEQQFNCPGVDLPFISIQRSYYGYETEYHTSLDNLDYVTPTGLDMTFSVLRELINGIENNIHYRVTTTCIPQLGKRGLYPTLSDIHSGDTVESMLDFLTYADGSLSLLELAETIEIPFFEALQLAEKFSAHGLIKSVSPCNSPWLRQISADTRINTPQQPNTSR
nr:DUF4910 domain-containing protein [uncultured Pseudodesulfovibrio sp.]